MNLNLELGHHVGKPMNSGLGIGAVGAGFIMRDVQLKAYADAGLNVAGIYSRTPEIAREVADLRGIPRTYETLHQMLADP
ncbi:MAG TPA: gfo/Idh/MocA family oxidoreductase, partial [Bryobacteraceae bacterium]|nr:gfo/Idh/MocA family oxidoreductase [Bryobacteraceae bacterium]